MLDMQSATDEREHSWASRPALAVLAWLRLARVFQKLDHASGQHVRQYGLSMAQFDILAQVGAHEGLTQQELAHALFVTKGNICQLITRMEGSVLIERRQDGRANRLYLTPEGRTLFRQVVPAQERFIEEYLSGLSAEEQRELLMLLRKLDRSLPSPRDI